MYLKVAFALSLGFFLNACGGGSDNNNNCSGNSSEAITISGNISYDFVPHDANGSLNYNAIQALPVPGASVMFIDGNDDVVARTTTDGQGNYAVAVQQGTNVRLRVAAELTASGGPTWQISVTDNTSANALYIMQGDSVCSGSADATRDLHASSGWTGSAYGEERVAAPFAILDSVYQALQLLLESDPDISLPEVEFRWSINNKAIPGNNAIGNIGTSSYDGDNIHILGDADNDTDEYDRAVIQHEFAHYLEDRIARSDSIGGSHSLNTQTDMRVVFSEGLANAFAAIAAGTGYYEDSVGNQQSNGFRFSLENNTAGNFGWFSENSTGQIVYDIFDTTNEAEDGLSLGFTPIYQALTSDTFTGGNARTSIYAFANALKSIVGGNEAAGIDDLLRAQQIMGEGEFGSNETNDGGSDITLPVYHSLSPGGVVNVCSDDASGSYNGYEVRRFLMVNISDNGEYEVRADKTSGLGQRDPDILIFQNNTLVDDFQSSGIDVESGDVNLNAGNYIIEFYDYNNVDRELPGGRSCFDVRIN